MAEMLNHSGPRTARREPEPIAFAKTFLLLTFLLSWCVEVPAALSAYGLIHVKVSGGLQTLAQLAPAVSALVLVSFRSRKAQRRRLLASAVAWRRSWKWYLAALLAPFATQGAAMMIFRASGHGIPALEKWYLAPLLTLGLGLFSFGEEIGWRGYYLDALLTRTSALRATFIVSFLWGLWHLPFYLARHVVGDQIILLYCTFFAGIFPVAALFTIVYLRTRSVLLCSLLHGALNAGAAFWFGPLAGGDAGLAFGMWVGLLWMLSIPLFHYLKQAPQPEEIALA